MNSLRGYTFSVQFRATRRTTATKYFRRMTRRVMRPRVTCRDSSGPPKELHKNTFQFSAIRATAKKSLCQGAIAGATKDFK